MDTDKRYYRIWVRFPIKGLTKTISGIKSRAYKFLITESLKDHNGNVKNTAAALGIDRSNLLRLIRQLGIVAHEYRGTKK